VINVPNYHKRICPECRKKTIGVSGVTYCICGWAEYAQRRYINSRLEKGRIVNVKNVI